MAKKVRICKICGKIEHLNNPVNLYYCRSCAISEKKKEQERIVSETFDGDKPAEKVLIEDVDNNTALITAYQGIAEIQIRYFKDRLSHILERLHSVSTYTIDPLTFDTKQTRTPITLTKNTVIIGAEYILGA